MKADRGTRQAAGAAQDGWPRPLPDGAAARPAGGAAAHWGLSQVALNDRSSFSY